MEEAHIPKLFGAGSDITFTSQIILLATGDLRNVVVPG